MPLFEEGDLTHLAASFAVTRKALLLQNDFFLPFFAIIRVIVKWNQPSMHLSVTTA